MSRRGRLTLIAITAILCGSSAALARAGCDTLAGREVPAGAIGLPTGGARIDTAAEYPATVDLPETCRVQGVILGHDRPAPPIRFQLNLPVGWNGKALQFGGGGFDGTVVDGLHAMPGNAPVGHAPANPLARGFATFGSDGGHQARNPMDASFGADPEARDNYAGAAVKKLHDVAVAITKAYYGTAPRRVYFAGGSKGGHEALVAAQRYGADYDGVISFYPAKDSVALIFGWGALTHAAYGPGGGALSIEKQAFLKAAILSACDALDGLRDGIVADTVACAATITPASLRCASDAKASIACLTAPEVALLDLASRRQALPFPLANGVASIGPFPILNGAPLEGTLLSAKGRSATVYDGFVRGIVQAFWTGDPTATIDTLDPARFRDSILAYSRASDATSTDLDAFVRHGGKMILVQGSVDMLVPPAATTDYYLRLAARYGSRTGGIARYFIQPGYSHGFGAFDLSWDSLSALDAWVETGRFPANPVATDGNAETRDRHMPLCEYPAFPRYIAGDARQAASFDCTDK